MEKMDAPTMREASIFYAVENPDTHDEAETQEIYGSLLTLHVVIQYFWSAMIPSSAFLSLTKA